MDSITLHADRDLCRRIRDAATRAEWGCLVGHIITAAITGKLRFESSIAPAPFVPTAFQKGILDALNGRALRARALDLAVKGSGRLYREHGLKELRERGLVDHGPAGYFRPDAPPGSSTPIKLKIGGVA